MAKRSKKRESTRRINVPMTIAMALFYLTLVSIYLTSGLYAKYTTQDRASDSSRVIMFGGLALEETCGFWKNDKFVEGDLTIIPGVDLVKDVEVSFTGSEADTYIFVEAEMKGWVTTDHVKFFVMSEEVKNDKGEVVRGSIELMSVSLNVDNSSWEYLTSDGNTHVYYKLLESNDKLTKADFVGEGGKVKVSAKMTRKDAEKLRKDAAAGNGIEMNITAYAAQASGFDGALEAWQSISKE